MNERHLNSFLQEPNHSHFSAFNINDENKQNLNSFDIQFSLFQWRIYYEYSI